MRLYRVQIHLGQDWETIWCRNSTVAKGELQTAKKSGLEAHIDQFDFPVNKETIVELLNNAGVHRMNLPGEEIARVKFDPKKRDKDQEDLLS